MYLQNSFVHLMFVNVNHHQNPKTMTKVTGTLTSRWWPGCDKVALLYLYVLYKNCILPLIHM